jgi:serine-type D-Ala-D-Ala carboxypeptidase/endopeptidase (penicillin-binding protein 4)
LTPSGVDPKNVGVRRAAVLLVLALGLLVPAAGAAPSARNAALAHKLARALSGPGISAARTGAYAIDLRSGAVVFAQNATRPLHPASVEKLTVMYAALAALGPTFRFHTELLGEGRRGGAVWHGDIVLRGYGDPTLSYWQLHAMAARVRALGIRRIQGRVLGDESFFDHRRTVAGWKSYYYMTESPPLSALVADRAIFRGHETRWPAAAAAALLKQALTSAGVRVAGPAKAARRTTNGAGIVLSSTHSAPLWKILRFMAQESDNFTAEMIVKELGALQGAGGSSPAGSAVIRELLKSAGVSLAGDRLVDGSGLSKLDRLTARTLVELLASAWAAPSIHKPFVGSLAVAGRNGTLAGRLLDPATRGHVLAKTGTTFISSALAGFVRGRYAFAIINNGSPINAWQARLAQDRFVTVLARAG